MASAKLEQRRENKVSRQSHQDSSAVKKEDIKSRSEVIRKLIEEKERKKHAKDEVVHKQTEHKEKQEKKKDQYRIPKKKPEQIVDVEKLMTSLFDDTETPTADNEPLISGSADHKPKLNGISDKKISSSSSSHREKSASSSSSSSGKHKSSTNEHSSHKDRSHSDKKLVSPSGKQSEHKSSLPSNGVEKSSDSRNKHKSNSEKSSSGSSKSREMEKSSSSGSTKNGLIYSSSKGSSSSSSKTREQSSSKTELKLSPSSSKNTSSSPGSADQQPVSLSKHHLNPTIERQASAGLSEKEKILARLQAIKQRTLEAIQQENSKGRRMRGERSHRKSKNDLKPNDDKAKSAEIIKDVPSSDDEDAVINDVPSALDIMLFERNAKLEKEKIARLAKQAWERATKKDVDSDKEAKVKKKHKSSHKDGHKYSKNDSKNNHKRKAHSLSPDRSSKKKRLSDSPQRQTSPKPKKPVIVKHSAQSAPPPMDFKAILAMAEKKQKEPTKNLAAIPKKKKELDERPLTQEEKDRRERVKMKEYQDWLKYGGKPPTQKDDLSDDNDEQPAQRSSNNSVDSRQKLQHSAQTDKFKGQTGSSKQSFNKNISNRDGPKHQQQVIPNGDSNRHKNITMNENILVCGPAGSTDDDDEGSSKSENPFDRIMNKFHKKRPVSQSKSAIPTKKQHFLDSEEEEYDSDMGSFIDDGEEEEPDYSKEIKKLFGYDKSKYKYERDEDLSDMEANFTTIMQEEKRSAKLGLMEDLEDMKREQEELKRKAMLKKRK